MDPHHEAGHSFDTPEPTPPPLDVPTFGPGSTPGAEGTQAPDASIATDATGSPLPTLAPQVAITTDPARTSLTVGVPVDGGVGTAPLSVALASGYFADVGLTDVTIVAVGDDALGAIASGEADLAVADARAAAMDDTAGQPALAIAGYQNYLGPDEDYGGTLLVADRDLVIDEPSTVTAFLDAYVRALADLASIATAEDASDVAGVLGLGPDGTDPEQLGAALAPFRPFDGGFGERAEGGGLGELDAYLGTLAEVPADLDLATLIAPTSLNLAQARVGIQPNPTNAFLGPLLPSMRVAMPVQSGAVSPIVVAATLGYFDDVGFASVDVMDVEEPMLGVLTGQVDLGVVALGDAADGIAQGLPIRLLAGHRNVAPDGSYGGDVLIATTDMIENEPASVAAFLVAYLRGMVDLASSANATVFAPFDGGFGSSDAEPRGLGDLEAFWSQAEGTALDVSSVIALDPLAFAQTSLGLPIDPVSSQPPVASSTGEGSS